MAKKAQKSDEVQPIIVKKVKKYAAGHHGGAWKVAYADFVTAMMAFFLLLWLLNVSTDAALNTISNYFDPTNPQIAQRVSGAGGLMGGLSVSPEGAQVTDVQALTAPQPTGMTAQGKARKTQKDAISKNVDMKKLEEELRKREETRFKKAKEDLEKAMQENPDLQALAKNLMVDITPEGLRIQIVDDEGRPMFAMGSAEMFDYTKLLVKQVSTVINNLPNKISVRGHTDSYQYAPRARYTNWELSSDRANASRRELLANAIPSERLANVMGLADTDHLDQENPLAPKNRRITILLMNEDIAEAFDRGEFDDMLPEEEGTTPEEAPMEEEEESPFDKLPEIQKQTPSGTFQKTPGTVHFP